MPETKVELPPIGVFNVNLFLLSDAQGVSGHLACQSKVSPIFMNVLYPDEGKEEPVHYILTWPSTVDAKEAIEIVRPFGAQEPDSTYIVMVRGDQTLEEQVDASRGDSAKVLSETTKDGMFEGFYSSTNLRDLQEVPGIDRIRLASRRINMGWEDNEYAEDGGKRFYITSSSDIDPLTDSYIIDLVKRTIISQHVGRVAVDLENLAAIFDKYRNGPPEQ